MQPLDRGNQENVVDTYFLTLKRLKDNVSKLFENYLHLLNEKLDCDSGKLLYCNTKPLCAAISEALNRVDELEIQLHDIDSWFELPVIQPLYQSGDLDRVSDDAQELIEIVKQFQSALRSIVTPKGLDESNVHQNDYGASHNYSEDDKYAPSSRSIDFPSAGVTVSPRQCVQQKQQHQRKLPQNSNSLHSGYAKHETDYIEENSETIIFSHQSGTQTSIPSEKVDEGLLASSNPFSSGTFPSSSLNQSRAVIRTKTVDGIMEPMGMEVDDSLYYLPCSQHMNQKTQETTSAESYHLNKMRRTQGNIQYIPGGVSLQDTSQTSGKILQSSHTSPSCYQYQQNTLEEYK